MYNIMYHMNDKHVLFTTFKVKGGVYLIRSLLKMCGIKSLIFSGDSSDAEKTDVLKRFNSKKNRNGVKYLLEESDKKNLFYSAFKNIIF